jgi:ABC-2 type transport system ATP-binding protein
VYGLRGRGLRDAVAAALERVDLAGDRRKRVVDYSGGMQRRLSLAIAMLHEPRALVLDEPTVGLDPLLRERIWARFRDLRDAGRGVIVTTHVMDEAEKCDRLVLIREGRVIAGGSPEQVKAAAGAPTLEAAFLHFSRVEAADA